MLDNRGAGTGMGAGLQEDEPVDYGGEPAGGMSAPRRSPAAAPSGGRSAAKPFDKKLDDEIPF
jgi:hypothetical protein